VVFSRKEITTSRMFKTEYGPYMCSGTDCCIESGLTKVLRQLKLNRINAMFIVM
jgi:hypothetical protein